MTNKEVLSPSAVAKGYGGQAVGEDLGEGVVKKLRRMSCLFMKDDDGFRVEITCYS
ncbi:MAG: hypothetical protein IIB64_04960 [Proteobacteria bacterium]|nr:hypothetical protein [Pseudomonadota bacterium]